MRRILVCGSRTFTDGRIIRVVLGGVRLTVDFNEEIVVIHGDAKGADHLGRDWAVAIGYTHEPYPADWDRYGKRAGYERNHQMLVEGKPDLVLAFVDKPLAESKGTAMMVGLARRAGVKTYVIEAAP